VHLPERIVRAAPLALATFGIAFTLGCDLGAARRRQLAAGNPLDRAAAIVQVCEAGDVTAVHKLVDLLDDSDIAVRMYAIQALHRLCGVDFGYRYFAPPGTRQVAVQRWREALRAGEVALRPTPPSAVSETGESPSGVSDGPDATAEHSASAGSAAR
jgi:hypothetical protein